jgi:hypothetical protein
MNYSKIIQKISCPITKEIMTHPVKAPDGIIYEYSAITKAINDTNISPISKKFMTVNQLKTDYNYCIIIDNFHKFNNTNNDSELEMINCIDNINPSDISTFYRPYSPSYYQLQFSDIIQ